MAQPSTIANSLEQIGVRAAQGLVSRPLPFLMLFLRVALFFLFGLAGVGIFALLGYPDPVREMTRWWCYQVILANIACFFILKAVVAKEKMRFRDLFGYDRSTLKKNVIFMLIMLVPSGAAAWGGMWGSQMLLYGSAAVPEIFFQPLPAVAAVALRALFPLSNALVETTVYFGYSLQRIEALGKRKGAMSSVLPALLASFFLAFQHIAIPMYFDPLYLLWRLLAFLPFALLAGFMFTRMRQLPPLMAVHFLADLGTALPILIVSLA